MFKLMFKNLPLLTIFVFFSTMLMPSAGLLLDLGGNGAGISLIPTAQASDANEESNDYDYWKKYQKYLKYKKYKDYKKYKEKYGFDNKAERDEYKRKYKLYKSDKKKYAQYYEEYKRYKKYKTKYKDKYAKYSKYKKYYKNKYKKYNKSKYKNAYNRYEDALEDNEVSTVDSFDDRISAGALGPDMKVGLLGYDKSYSKDHSMRFKANRDYVIKDKNGAVLSTLSGSTETKVKYAGDGKLSVYGDGFSHTVDQKVDFEAADGNNEAMIFDLEPKTFDDYRGRMRVNYSDDADEVWAINILPLEHYVWGMGEITGTGDMDYNKVMTVTFRTYGYWKILYSTKHAEKGFKVDTTAGDQIYYGYDWEEGHQRIKQAALETRGQIVTYDNEVAITPYSSSTDGRTRSWKEVWGSSNYPYCVSVDDPWGKVDGAASIAGNHMVGLSATGALNLADDEGWSYSRILNYYYTGIDIAQAY